jgi:hypothetical protein
MRISSYSGWCSANAAGRELLASGRWRLRSTPPLPLHRPRSAIATLPVTLGGLPGARASQAGYVQFGAAMAQGVRDR